MGASVSQSIIVWTLLFIKTVRVPRNTGSKYDRCSCAPIDKLRETVGVSSNSIRIMEGCRKNRSAQW